MVIPNSFKCPAAGQRDSAQIECDVFGSLLCFCPYASMAALNARRLYSDCSWAPPEIWRHFKNYKERCDMWMEEGI